MNLKRENDYFLDNMNDESNEEGIILKHFKNELDAELLVRKINSDRAI